MKTIRELLAQYLDYLEIEKNRSVKTRESYERYLKRFISAAGIEQPGDITTAAIRSFRLKLARIKQGRDGGELKKNTQSYYAIAIRNFLRYLVRNGYRVPTPDHIELPKLSDREIALLDHNDLERILEAPEGGGAQTLRDRAIMEVLFSTGLRLSELCGLDRHLDLKRGEITVRGKGEKLRIVFLSDRAKRAIAAYLESRADAESALFVSYSRRGAVIGRITPRTVERLVDRYARRAGVASRVTPHTFRHLFATDLLLNGADLRSVQELLGHRNVSTTQVYTHLTNRELRDVHRAFHGRRRK
jgi:site-specific recombinase XerD